MTASMAKTCLSLPTYELLAREKSSATKDITKSVLVALLIFLAANSNLSLSSSAVNLITPQVRTTQQLIYFLSPTLFTSRDFRLQNSQRKEKSRNRVSLDSHMFLYHANYLDPCLGYQQSCNIKFLLLEGVEKSNNNHFMYTTSPSIVISNSRYQEQKLQHYQAIMLRFMSSDF